jgi:hypothetical protein
MAALSITQLRRQIELTRKSIDLHVDDADPIIMTVQFIHPVDHSVTSEFSVRIAMPGEPRP